MSAVPSNKDRAAAFYEWQKALLNTGETALTRAAGVAIVVAQAGDFGHRCYPSVARIAGRTGLSHASVARRVKILRETGYLRARRRNRQPTVYCIGLVQDRVLIEPGVGSPCPQCAVPWASTVTGDSRRLARASDHQDSLSREAAAREPPSEFEEVNIQLSRLLMALRTDVTDTQLIVFDRVMSGYVGTRTVELLEAATVGLADARVITENSVRKFVELQQPPTPSRRSASKPPADLVMAVEVEGWDHRTNSGNPF